VSDDPRPERGGPSPELQAHLAGFAERTALADRLQWLEDAARLATEASSELGEAGDRAALDLRAALGAIITWARGPKDPATLVDLEATVRTFTRRALYTLYTALAGAYAGLSKQGVQRGDAEKLAAIYKELADAVRLGVEPKAATRAKIEALAKLRRSPK
jgi:hypothetical protein